MSSIREKALDARALSRYRASAPTRAGHDPGPRLGRFGLVRKIGEFGLARP
jgi:hypothetical protein